MKKIKEFLVYTGIWTIPAAIILGEIAKSGNMAMNYGFKQELIVGILFTIYIFAINSFTKQNGKPIASYHLLDAFSLRSEMYGQRHRPYKEIYPPVPENMLCKHPNGFVIGKWSGKYVCDDLKSGSGHYLILGQSGCGKSVTILGTLLNNLKTKAFTVFAIDIKGELHRKGSIASDQSTVIIDPDDENSWGYDPLYMIGSTFTQQQLIEAVSGIAYSIVPIIADEKNKFWTDSARDLLMACTIYYFKQGFRDLISIFDAMSESPIAEVIDDVASCSATDSAEYKIISRYVGMAEETLSGIAGQMYSCLTVFLQDEKIRYMLRDNPKKASPEMLNSDRSVYVVIPEHKLSDYSKVLHLIINQTISCMEQRPEGLKRVVMLIDELPRILSAGRIEKLENALETLRSRCVSLILIAQSTDALERAYCRAAVQGMTVNVNKLILSASSKGTTDNVVRWAGKYMGIRFNQSRSYKNGSNSVSYELKDRVEPSELITLPLNDEAIIITNNGYNRVKKVKYYEDKYLKKMYQEVKESWMKLKKSKK